MGQGGRDPPRADLRARRLHTFRGPTQPLPLRVRVRSVAGAVPRASVLTGCGPEPCARNVSA